MAPVILIGRSALGARIHSRTPAEKKAGDSSGGPPVGLDRFFGSRVAKKEARGTHPPGFHFNRDLGRNRDQSS